MLCNFNESLESRNFIDDVNFSKNDPCLWVVYPAGAAGDLLISIIDKHYLRTGCEYYGITDSGAVKMYTTDYELVDIELKATNNVVFNDQWFFNLAEKLGERRLNYSLLDQVIFGCHMYTPAYIKHILDTFPCAKIINIYPKDARGLDLIRFLSLFKNKDTVDPSVLTSTADYQPELVDDPRVLNIPFGSLFNDVLYNTYYNVILQFLGLNGQLICFDYIKFYLSKQHPEVKNLLINYSESL